MAEYIHSVPGMATPSGYSYAVKKRGTPVFLAGQVAIDGEGKIVGEGDVAQQVEQIFDNLRRVLAACGGTLRDVVKLNVFVTDPSHRPAITQARLRHFAPGEAPASTYLVVSALALPQLLVEIEAIAVIE